jgi:hypothetical protein
MELPVSVAIILAIVMVFVLVVLLLFTHLSKCKFDSYVSNQIKDSCNSKFRQSNDKTVDSLQNLVDCYKQGCKQTTDYNSCIDSLSRGIDPYLGAYAVCNKYSQGQKFPYVAYDKCLSHVCATQTDNWSDFNKCYGI